jgi:hypothetical protein
VPLDGRNAVVYAVAAAHGSLDVGVRRVRPGRTVTASKINITCGAEVD